MSTGIKEIAEACGLSTNSVSDILNRGRQHLYRPETRDRVVKAAAELHYRPNRTARAMRTKRTQAVGFLAFNMNDWGILENYSVYPFLIGMSHYFTDRRFHVSLVEMKELQAGAAGTIPEVLRENFFDGLVLHYGVPEGVPTHVREMVSDLQIPVIWWDASVFQEFDCIYRDETAVARDLTRQLLQLGHRHIAFKVGLGYEKYLRGEPVHLSYKQRYEAYHREMIEHDLEPLQLKGYDHDEITHQLRDLRITAVITMGTIDLHNIMLPCMSLGMRIPHDLTVASCDTEARLPRAHLNCGGMYYDRYDAGQRAATMLLSKIENPNVPVPTERLLGEFLKGETIAPPA